jgi:outer membrane immunogenic protein
MGSHATGVIIMKRILLGSMALIALGLSAPALAADMPVKVKAPPPVVVYDWSGAYVGFNIGGVWTEIDRHYPNLPAFGVQADYESKGDDVIYGFHAGAQGQWGNWVLGIEAAYSACFRECQSSVRLSNAIFVGPPIDAYSKMTNLFTVGPRLGFAWDRWMVYGTGGYAIATIKGQYLNTATGLQTFPPPVNLSGQTWNDGWFAGGGVEYMVHKGALVDVILGAEYQHFDVRSKRAFTGTGEFALVNFDQDAVGDIVRARLTIKTQGWGWSGPWATAPVAAKN